MPTKIGFYSDPLPAFLANEPEHQRIGDAWDRAVISSRVFKASILLGWATAFGIVILSVGDPITLFADATASFEDATNSTADKSALQPGSNQSTPTIQSIADTQPLPPAAKDAPTRDKIAAASEPAGQRQAENSEPASEALFREFQAWKAEKDAQPQVGRIQPAEDTSAQVTENARASVRPVQKHRHVRSVQSEREEIRPANNPQKRVRREQTSRLQIPRAQNAAAQDQSAQNAEAPSFLQKIFGWGN